MKLLRPLPLLALRSGLLSAQAEVWVVDGQGSGDFSTIPAAIAAAVPGDTILVHTGTYGSFTLGKSLTITAGEGTDVSVSGFTVAGIPVAQTAVVRGLATSSPILLDGNAGTVWLEEVSTAVLTNTPALTVQSCAAVVIIRSDFVGGPGYSTFLLVDPGPALSAADSVIHMHGSLLRGGAGYLGESGFSGHDGGDGAPGAILDGTFLFLADSKIVGGSGGPGDSHNPICADPGDGGPGIAFAGGDSQVHTFDAESMGGSGGVDTTFFGECFGATGHTGPAILGAAGTVSSFSGDALALVTPRTVQPGGDLKLALSGGPPGAPVFLGLGAAPTAVFLPPLFGTLLVEGPYDVVSLGVLDAAGELAASMTAPALTAGDEAVQLHVQAGYVSAALEVVLGAPSEIAVADASPAVKSVWIVDASGGGDFTSFQAALAIAQPGHTLLVKGGAYESFDLSVPLTILADEGQSVTVSSLFSTLVHDIPAGQRAVLRGIDFAPATLRLIDNAGLVWMEEVTSNTLSFAQPGLEVRDYAQVVLVRSTFHGAEHGLPGHGIFARDSQLHLHDVVAEGGDGIPAVPFGAFYIPAGGGAAGAQLQDMLLVASDSEFLGGKGGAGASEHFPCGAPGNGGIGLELVDVGVGSEVHHIDCTFAGGAGGVDATPGGFCTGATGLQGPAFAGVGISGTVALMSAEESLALVASSPVREGGLLELELDGPPGAPVFLALGEAPLDLFVPSLAGTILVAPPYLVLPLGALDGGGTLEAQFQLLDLPPGVEAKHYYGQAGYVTGAGGVILGAPSVVTLLDAAL